ncbi:MarR family winged helix-turn-helix transcriptional regulator [Niallia sp. FSL W8-0635]|uniref:MarR family winged helix-turn-helix transcriptional regulator n=1 Tax=Niallia sp. FSL W8-0635 TaxID=2975337 RepID=UPI0009D1B562|nr:transcriptional regulator SlyA [Mycobacteroides abscessus subsp. abscessus]HEO8419134.1 MarR family transcriptional regulator [Yersinia enterocolitica]
MDYKKIIQAFGILNRTFLSYSTKSLSGEDLSYSDSIFLFNIGVKEGIIQKELSNVLAIDKAAIARSVKNMQKKGFVRVVPSSLDKREKELYLTASGERLFQSLQKINKLWIDYTLDGLNHEEVETFCKVLDKISNRARDFSYDENMGKQKKEMNL